jgi:hypothetical protein
MQLVDLQHGPASTLRLPSSEVLEEAPGDDFYAPAMDSAVVAPPGGTTPEGKINCWLYLMRERLNSKGNLGYGGSSEQRA